MNVQRIMDIISSSKLSKVDIASKMKVSRTTLDNLLNGADVKVSTIESLAEVLGVSVSEFFDSNNDKTFFSTPSSKNDISDTEKELIALKAENKLLRELQGLSVRNQVHVG